jgi:hypothetical protein
MRGRSFFAAVPRGWFRIARVPAATTAARFMSTEAAARPRRYRGSETADGGRSRLGVRTLSIRERRTRSRVGGGHARRAWPRRSVARGMEITPSAGAGGKPFTPGDRQPFLTEMSVEDVVRHREAAATTSARQRPQATRPGSFSVRPMSALPPIADIALHRSECPLCAKSGHQFGLEFTGPRTL